MTIQTAIRRIATYERVSSEDQRERETIKTQTDELARRLEREADVALVEHYADDGVSGTIPLAERPAGGRLMRDAAAGRFGELWVYKLDRLGRDAVDLLVVRRRFLDLGIRVISVVEAEPDLLSYDVQAVVADHARREFLRRSSDGMARAAREGRYTGGIVAYGYRVEGRNESARLIPDDTTVWAGRSAADVVRQIYGRLGLEGWSCRRIADELNALGVPTHYVRDGRGVRGKRTQGIWRLGRIRNMVVNPTYKGMLRYGRRASKPGREVIAASIEPLVSAELWAAAQETLARNRVCAKNTRRRYLLRSVIRCGTCELTYIGSQGRDEVGWYRCNGQLVERGSLPHRCPNPSVRTDAIEPAVWADIERFLRHPGDVLEELDGQAERDAQGAVAEAERIALERALAQLDGRRAQVLREVGLGRFSDAEVNAELATIATERAAAERRIEALAPAADEASAAETVDLLTEIRARLDAGLAIEQRQEIVRLLVRIVIRPDVQPDGRKRPRAVITYRFPMPGVVQTRTVTGSWLPRAESGPGR